MDVIDAQEDVARARRMFDKMLQVVKDEGEGVSAVAIKTSFVFVVHSFCKAANVTAKEFYQMLLDCEESRKNEEEYEGGKS